MNGIARALIWAVLVSLVSCSSVQPRIEEMKDFWIDECINVKTDNIHAGFNITLLRFDAQWTNMSICVPPEKRDEDGDGKADGADKDGNGRHDNNGGTPCPKITRVQLRVGLDENGNNLPDPGEGEVIYDRTIEQGSWCVEMGPGGWSIGLTDTGDCVFTGTRIDFSNGDTWGCVTKYNPEVGNA